MNGNNLDIVQQYILNTTRGHFWTLNQVLQIKFTSLPVYLLKPHIHTHLRPDLFSTACPSLEVPDFEGNFGQRYLLARTL